MTNSEALGHCKTLLSRPLARSVHTNLANMIRSILLGCCIMLTSLLSAQTSVAHVNTGIVLEALPGSAVADSLLRQYQDSLAMGFKALEQEFAGKLAIAQDPAQVENMTVKQQEALQRELQELQQQAGIFQEQAASMFEARRVTYLQPLVDKVRLAIEAYAKTNNIDLVLDTSVGGVMVYADETKDITEAVKALVLKTQ